MKSQGGHEMRERSPKTIIAELRRELREAQRMRARALDETRFQVERANRAEQECREWKIRFDQVLARVPELPRVS